MSKTKIYYQIDKFVDFLIINFNTFIKFDRENECDCLAVIYIKKQHRQCHKSRVKVENNQIKIIDVTNLIFYVKSNELLC